MADTKFAQFNSITVTGRISHVEVVTKDGNEFLSVTVPSTLTKDGQTVNFTFTNSNGLLSLYKKDGLPVGREVTLMGSIKTISETYFDKKAGGTRMLQKPRVQLVNVIIPDGGLGRKPRDKDEVIDAKNTVVLTDPAPAM